MPGLKKRSVNLAGHATSVALEPEFWVVLETISKDRRISLAALIAELDSKRGESLLASFCRLSALAYVQNKTGAPKRKKPWSRSARTTLGANYTICSEVWTAGFFGSAAITALFICSIAWSKLFTFCAFLISTLRIASWRRQRLLLTDAYGIQSQYQPNGCR